MRKTLLIIVSSFALFSCGQNNISIRNNQDSALITTSVSKPNNPATLDNTQLYSKNWYDSLVLYYIKHTDNELIRLASKDTIPEEWLLDRIENTDTARYLVFQIGHGVVDEGDLNKRFITDGWIYIDSLKRKIFEYNLPNEKLIEWDE